MVVFAAVSAAVPADVFAAVLQHTGMSCMSAFLFLLSSCTFNCDQLILFPCPCLFVLWDLTWDKGLWSVCPRQTALKPAREAYNDWMLATTEAKKMHFKPRSGNRILVLTLVTTTRASF